LTQRLALIAARDRKGAIGKEGALPWRLASDMAHFKRVTAGKPCLMGRKTWESLPDAFRPLPGRPCLVLTRDAGYWAEGAEIFTDFDAMITRAHALADGLGVDEVIVIGGAELYALALPKAQRLYLTEVDADVSGDAHFPALNDGDWIEVHQERAAAGPRDEFAFTLRTLDCSA